MTRQCPACAGMGVGESVTLGDPSCPMCKGLGVVKDGPPEPRCGPWDERADGTFVCRKCGEVDAPGTGPSGY